MSRKLRSRYRGKLRDAAPVLVLGQAAGNLCARQAKGYVSKDQGPRLASAPV